MPNCVRPKPRTALGVHQAILNLLKFDESKQILDLGSGEGALSEKLISLGHNITACDGDSGQFKLKQITCQKVDLNQALPFNNSQFDIVILSDVIEHLENPWHIIREACRVLKPAGKLILSIPNIISIVARIHFLIHGEHLFFYQAKDNAVFPHITPINYPLMEKILTSIGFKVNRVLSNVSFIKECDAWELDCTKWYRYKKPSALSLVNIIGMAVKIKVHFSKYIYKNKALLQDVFFFADAIIIEAVKME